MPKLTELEKRGFVVEKSTDEEDQIGKLKDLYEPEIIEETFIDKPKQIIEPEERKNSLNAIDVIMMSLRVVNERLLVLLSGMGSFVLFGYVALHPNPWAFGAATAFTLGVFCMMLWKFNRR